MKKGFTLIELLVVISIIGVLSSLVLVSFTRSQQQARDSQRKNDLRQYQLALENYSTANNSLYPGRNTPSAGGARASTTLCNDLGQFISGCPGPEDPRYNDDSSFMYRYKSDGTNNGQPTALSWVLWGKMEDGTNYWVICSNGKSGKRQSSTPNFVTNAVNCPI